MIEIVGILIAAGDSEHSSAQNIDHTVRHQQWIARIGDQPRHPMCNPYAPLGSGHKHHTPIRGEAAAIERRSEFLTSDGWKTKRRNRIVMQAGVARADRLNGMVSTPDP